MSLVKQHITPSQAKEVTEDQFYSIIGNKHWGSVRRADWANFHHKKATIGKCIEILEESNRFKGLHKSDTDGEYKVYVNALDKYGQYIKSGKELIDALFEAVKSIL